MACCPVECVGKVESPAMKVDGTFHELSAFHRDVRHSSRWSMAEQYALDSSSWKPPITHSSSSTIVRQRYEDGGRLREYAPREWPLPRRFGVA